MKFDESSLYSIKSDLDGTRRSLFDLAIWKNGLAFKKIDFSEIGRPVIKIAELNNGINSNTSFTLGDYGEEVFIRWDDLLFSWSGNPKTSIDVFRYRLQDGWLNQHIFKVTANGEFVTKDFLYYVLKFLKPHFTEIAKNKQTTGLGHVTIADLKRMSLVIPSKKVQSQIISILKAIDDKIEVNTSINKNLLQQAQVIYNDMFITNANPSWQSGQLSDLITVRYGKDHKKLADGAYPVYGSGGIMRYVERPLYDKESVLIPRKGTLNNVMYVNEPFWSVDTMFFTEMRLPDVAKFVFHFVKSRDLVALNAGSAVPSMTTDILNAMELLIPDADTLTKFENVVAPMYLTVQQNTQESSKLAELRDSLLPRLMSGEIDVSDIDL
jgi:hsdS, type I site-specific deoxyribonuclease